MRKAIALFTAALAVLAWSGCDSVVTRGWQTFDGSTLLSIDARSGPSGEQPSGTLGWHVGGGLGPTWLGSVSCLAVSANTAVIGFSGRHSFGGTTVNAPIAGLVRVADLGGPSSALDTFEWAVGSPGPNNGPPIPGPTDCSTYPGGFTPPSFPPLPAVNDFGDVIVTDLSPPLPVSKDQCKNGGWRVYGIFKNQGDCVSFVATGGRNQPSGP
jgi:hypothetical protein